MTQNMRIGNKGSITITSNNSDVANTFIVPNGSALSFTTTADVSQVYFTGTVNNGGYYTWRTATAGSHNNSNAPYSICAKGWGLPSKDDAQRLLNSYNSNIMELASSPANFLRVGWIAWQSFYNDSTYWWTSTYGRYDNNSGAAIPYELIYGFRVASEKTLGHGMSIRCVNK